MMFSHYKEIDIDLRRGAMENGRLIKIKQKFYYWPIRIEKM